MTAWWRFYGAVPGAAAAIVFGVALGTAAGGSPASATEYVIATSGKQKLRVIAGEEKWCGPEIRLRMILADDSPILGNPSAQVGVMNRLKAPITSECRAAESARITVVGAGIDPHEYVATASGGWTFARASVAPEPDAPAAPSSGGGKASTPAPSSPATGTPDTASAGAAAAPERTVHHLDPEYVAMYYHRTNGVEFDFSGTAKKAETVRVADAFDRPEQQKLEEERLRRKFDETTEERDFRTRVHTAVGEYDFDRGEFSIQVFESNRYLTVEAFGTRYKLIFENADKLRAIRMPKDEARQFHSRLGTSSWVPVELLFTLTGAGDPTGRFASANTVRARVSSAQLLTNTGASIYEVKDTASASDTGATAKAPTDWDVSGLRLGMTVDAFAQAAKTAYSGSTLVLNNDTPCGGPNGFALTMPRSGTVCVSHKVRDGLVQQFSVKQVLDSGSARSEPLRKLLIEKFGPVTASAAGHYGWGAAVGGELPKNHTVYAYAYGAADPVGRDSGNSVPVLSIIVTDPRFAQATLDARKGPAPVKPKL